MQRSLLVHLAWGVIALIAFLVGYNLAGSRGAPPGETIAVLASDHARESAAESPARATREREPADAPPKPSSDDVRVRIVESLREPGRVARTAQLCEVLAQISPDNWRGVLAAFDHDVSREGRSLSDEFRLALESVGAIVGAAALEETQASKCPDKELRLRALMVGWATADPDAAMKWAPKAHPFSLEDEVLTGMARIDSTRAFLFATDPRTEHFKSIPSIVDIAVAKDGFARAEQLFATIIGRSEVRDWVKSKVFQELAVKKYVVAESKGEVAAMLAWMDPYMGQEWDHSDTVHGFAFDLGKLDPQQVMEWFSARVDRLTEKQAGYAFRGVAIAWGERDPMQFQAWIAAHPDHRYHEDMVYGAANMLLARGRRDEFERWAASDQHPETRGGLERALRNHEAVKAQKQ
jgi:hypothetical protein